MPTLVIDRQNARLRLDGGCVRVDSPDGSFTAPLGQIERVIVKGPGVIETGLLSRLWSEGIGLLVLSGRRGEATARFHGQPHNDVRRRIAQITAATDLSRSLDFASEVVVAKIAAQARTLAVLAAARPAVRRGEIAFSSAARTLAPALRAASDLDAVRGCEGAAARLYWSALQSAFAPALRFSGRNRRPPRDPVNVALSLAYTIATFEASAQAQRWGLDPMVGYLHAPAFGRESLACDIVEPLRPRIDLWVEALFRARRLRVEHFSSDPDGACRIGKAGRAAFYEALGEVSPGWSRWLGRAARRVCAALSAAPCADEPASASAPVSEG